MWYRWGAVTLVGGMLGCSDAAAPEDVPGPTEPPPTMQQDAPSPTQQEGDVSQLAPLDLSIEGWAEAIRAKALLKVTEGVVPVQLQITGGGQQDVLLLDVDFEDLKGSMGPHRLEVGLPGQGLDSAIASVGGQAYHSQAGLIEVTLLSDGSISGAFDLALAPDPDVPAGEPIVFEPSDDTRPLRGQFSGRWELYCQSHLAGHSSSLMKGGKYCDGLEF